MLSNYILNFRMTGHIYMVTPYIGHSWKNRIVCEFTDKFHE